MKFITNLKSQFRDWSTLKISLAFALLGIAIYFIFTGFYLKVNFNSLTIGTCTVIWAGYLLYMLFGFISFSILLIDRLKNDIRSTI